MGCRKCDKKKKSRLRRGKSFPCPMCKAPTFPRTIYEAWCWNCGGYVEIRDQKPHRWYTKEELGIIEVEKEQGNG